MRIAGLQVARGLLCILCICLFAKRGWAAGTESIPTVTVQFSLHPTPATRPALRYRFLPDLIDQTAGNAADAYAQICNDATIRRLSEKPFEDWLVLTRGWLGINAKAVDAVSIRQRLGEFNQTLDAMEKAARIESCDWKLRDRKDGLRAPLPLLTPLRRLAVLLALRAHVEISEGRYDSAARSLQTGFAVARHLQDGCLFETLVGIGIDNLMLDEVEYWVSLSGSPNLYWPLTHLVPCLPDPVATFERDYVATRITIPFWREAAAGTLTAEQLQQMLAFPKADLVDKVNGAMQMFTEARAFELQRGRSEQELRAMQPSQLIGLWITQSMDEWSEEVGKWAQLSRGEARRMTHWADWEKEIDRSSNVYAKIFCPTISGLLEIDGRLHQRVAELRCLEALRHYAATHDGQLPRDLQAMNECPAPIDPGTDEPFIYVVDGNKAKLALARIGFRKSDAIRSDEIEFAK